VSQRIGPYEVIRRLGQGGMAIVDEVRHVETGGRYALKRLDPALAGDAQLRARFTREARALASLDHPNVVGVHAAELDGPEPYFVQPLLSGGTLQDLVRVGDVPFSLAHRLVVEVAQGLAHAHERGVLHRDLKPENVLIDERQHAQLSDFGLAHVGPATPLTKTGEVLGTPVYMAPEQARDGSAADPRSDVYGLGGILYALLTGRPPFESEGRGVLPLLSRIQRDAPPSITTLRPDAPPALVRVCERALAKDPARRPLSARAFLEALHADPPARRPALGAGILGAVVGLLALSLLWALRPPPPAPTGAAPLASRDPTPAGSTPRAPDPGDLPPPAKPAPWTGDLRVIPLLAKPKPGREPRGVFTPEGILIHDGQGALLRCPDGVLATPSSLKRVGDAPSLSRPYRTVFHVHQGVRLLGLWGLDEGAHLHWLSGHAAPKEKMQVMSATSRGSLLAVTNYRGGIRLYEMRGGVLEELPKPLEISKPHEVVFDGDDAYAVGEMQTGGEPSGVVIHFHWEGGRGWREWTVGGQLGAPFRCIALRPDREVLVLGDNVGCLREFSTEALTPGEVWSGKPRDESSPVLGSHPNATLRDCAFVAGGRLLLSLAEVQQPGPSGEAVVLSELRVWDPITQRESQEVLVFPEGSQDRLTVSDDGRRVLFGTSSQVYLVEVR
jgi:tRNA A-37 threonylcarbamoyl transferase component Bud32